MVGTFRKMIGNLHSAFRRYNETFQNPSKHDKFLEILDDYGLTQHVNKPTRLYNTLDLFVTNNPTLINKVEVLPGLADHNAVLIEGDISAISNKRRPRRIPFSGKHVGMASRLTCKYLVMQLATESHTLKQTTTT